jgi:hypothetical protein
MMPSRWDWECGLILLDIKTVKTVWPERFMISFYPWLKPWAMEYAIQMRFLCANNFFTYYDAIPLGLGLWFHFDGYQNR